MNVAGSSLLYSRLSLADACERLAGLGFGRVDLGAMVGWAHVEPAEIVGDIDGVVGRIESACDEAGLDPVAFNASAGDCSPAEERERVDALAAVADRLGAGVLTLQGADPDTDLAADRDRFRALVGTLEDREVDLAVETHWGTHLEDPAVAARYAEIRGLGLTLDPSHYAIGPYWEAGYDDLLPHVRHVHLRQAGDGWENVQRPVDDGKIDVAGFIADLRDAEYDGALAVEYIDSLDGVDPDDAERQADAMRRAIEDAL